jgi:hypothetical protein
VNNLKSVNIVDDQQRGRFQRAQRCPLRWHHAILQLSMAWFSRPRSHCRHEARDREAPRA